MPPNLVAQLESALGGKSDLSLAPNLLNHLGTKGLGEWWTPDPKSAERFSTHKLTYGVGPNNVDPKAHYQVIVSGDGDTSAAEPWMGQYYRFRGKDGVNPQSIRIRRQHPDDWLEIPIAGERVAAWHAHRVAAPRDPDVWREPGFLLDDRTDPEGSEGHFLGPQDAYDERGWQQRYRDHPPDPTPVGVDWYHATFHDLPVGTVLDARKGKAPWLDAPYHGGLDNRAHWTWVEHDLTHSDDWMKYLVRDHGQAFLYRVEPHRGPWPWNGDAREGWVTDKARIVEKIRSAGEG